MKNGKKMNKMVYLILLFVLVNSTLIITMIFTFAGLDSSAVQGEYLAWLYLIVLIMGISFVPIMLCYIVRKTEKEQKTTQRDEAKVDGE